MATSAGHEDSNPGASVTLLCGFLGAGKTTLLNYILSARHGLKIGVVVNDFGELNIDSQLVVGIDGATVSLENGCICCTLADGFVEAIAALMRRADRPSHILIETSGAADPVTVARTLSLMERTTAIRTDAIVTVVDAEQFPLLDGENLTLAQRQIRVADLLVLNKVDLVSAAQAKTLEGELGELTKHSRILLADHARVPLEVLFGAAHLPLPAPDSHGGHAGSEHAAHLDHHLVTFSYVADRALRREHVRALMLALPRAVLRVKGLLYLAEHPECQAVLHVVGRRVSLTRGDPWRGRPHRSQLVFVGTAVDAKALEAELALCAVGGLAAAALPLRSVFNRIRRLAARR